MSNKINILIPVAPGELIDKITILQIKKERIGDDAKLRNIAIELGMLEDVLRKDVAVDTKIENLSADLKVVNEEIWDLEDTIRDCERNKDFSELFLETARKIYATNDKRAALKKEINTVLGSDIVEEKSYSDY